MSITGCDAFRRRGARAALAPLRNVRTALRPGQCVKNGALFAALLFSIGRAWQPLTPSSLLPLLARSVLAFTAFSLVASAGYLVNDVHDRERDRQHPRKRHRPVAAGRLPITLARRAAALIFGLGLLSAVPLGSRFAALLAAYALLMLGYTYTLKRLALIDVCVIACGFVLRAAAGAVAIRVPISGWLLLCTTLLALVLALGKRYGELQLLGAAAAAHRPALRGYRRPLLEALLSGVAGAALLAYVLYALVADRVPRNHAMLATVPCVLVGLGRYLTLVYHHWDGVRHADVPYRDRLLLGAVTGWIVTCGLVLGWSW